MALFKCKMCGGTIEFEQGTTVGICDSCGTKQTLPKMNDDKKENLYDRAAHFRRSNDFDKAIGIYEQILNEDKTDAEAYWSLVLCRYGIEYVEDPVSHKRVPTVNRAQFTSIFADEDYRAALKYADSYQKVIYEEEARTIDEIHKGILSISQKEKPFDVFICYKETDSYGRRTQDSVLANDLYHQLTQEGFKVFFSRITLEDKLGTAYEPYIFAALNSAKVMVVLGTRPEYFNAVWVKNEWSRYLSLIKKGSKKVLIPAYRDMNPYDLPDEFSNLQAQDMSKLGFMQDLIRGIKKIVQVDEKSALASKSISDKTIVNVDTLAKRVFLFLEETNWKTAESYCEKILDQDPENANAYLGRLMCELHVKTIDDLRNQPLPISDMLNYQRAIRFGDAKMKDMLVGINDFIIERNEEERKRKELERFENMYRRAFGLYNGTEDVNKLKTALGIFESIEEYKDSKQLAQECEERIKTIEFDVSYNRAVDLMNKGHVSTYERAIELFDSIREWKDSSYKIEECKILLQDLEEKNAREAAEKKHEYEKQIEQRAKKRKRDTKIVVIVAIICFVLIISAIVYKNVIVPKKQVAKALEFANDGQYSTAIQLLEELNGKGGSDEVLLNVLSNQLDELSNNFDALANGKEFDKAIDVLDEMSNYGYSKNDMLNKVLYLKAAYLEEAGDFENAWKVYCDLGNYEDSMAKAETLRAQSLALELSKAKVGDSINFGQYGCDSFVKTFIEWEVVSIVDGKALLVSKVGITGMPFTDKERSLWEASSLREWLNNAFYKDTFNEIEKKYIINTVVQNKANPQYGTQAGLNTVDRIFILNIEEALSVWNNDTNRRLRKAYDVNSYEMTYSNDNTAYILRTPGNTDKEIAYVMRDGSINYYGYSVNRTDYAVRPAMWVKIS